MNTIVSRLPAERRFYVSAAVGITVVVLAGFSVDVDLLHSMSRLTTLVRLHGAVMLAWIALFVTQTVLIARWRVDWHRRLGIFGAALAAAVLITGSATSIVASRLGGEHLPSGMPPQLFLARSLFLLLAFAILVSSAIALRGESGWHKRLMLLATIVLLDAALARFINVYTNWDLDPAIARDLFVILCVAIDTWRYRRLHPAFLAGALLLFVMDPLATWVAASSTWVRFCTWLV
ncbi:MAG TPA: hypothetical protein VMA54_18330 [Steroidobacteraceae bacterium]|nr:hypothetical protein [Steroidobacteraceae bacterium]